MKQYKFTSRSALSFAVTQNGRQTYVSFSPAYRGLSFFITTDESLAEKIRKHRWYREGRINEQIVEIKPAQEEKPFQPTMPPEPKKYSILGKTMATNIQSKPQQKQEVVQNELPQAEQTISETAPAHVAEEVTSFMEAKEFFITNYGVSRSEVANKESIAQLCREYSIHFPNYQL